MGRNKILLLSPIQLYTQSGKKDHTRQSQGSSGSTAVADTVMVSHAFSNIRTTTSCPSTSAESVTNSTQAGAEAPTTQKAKNSYLSCIRGKLQVKGFSADMIDIILSSRREGTQTQYKLVAKRWFEFCDKNSCDVIAMIFLSDLFHSGLSYSYINTARSVLSSLLQLDGHIPFGQLPIVKRFMKGIFGKQPALPRYSSTWDVNVVFSY